MEKRNLDLHKEGPSFTIKEKERFQASTKILLIIDFIAFARERKTGKRGEKEG